jgi:hypothetical protein
LAHSDPAQQWKVAPPLLCVGTFRSNTTVKSGTTITVSWHFQIQHNHEKDTLPTLFQKWNLKKTNFWTQWYQTFYMIYPSAKITQWNQLMSSMFKFWKIKYKTLRIS